MAEPIINETEEKVVSQPTEEPKTNLSLNKEERNLKADLANEGVINKIAAPKKDEPILYKLEDGNQVNVPFSSIEKFEKQYPTATKVTEEVTMPKVEVKDIDLVGEAPKGKTKTETTDDDYNKVYSLLSQNDLLATSFSPSKIEEANNIPVNPDLENLIKQRDQKNVEIEYAKRNEGATYDFGQLKSELFDLNKKIDAIQVDQTKKQQDYLNNLHEKDKSKLEAFAKAYAEKNDVDLKTAKDLVNKVYNDAWDIKNNQDAYQQSSIKAQSILENSWKNTNGDYDLDENTFREWSNAATTAEQAQYNLIKQAIDKKDYDSAIKLSDQLQDLQLQNANVESHFAFTQGNKLDRSAYAKQRMATSVAVLASAQYGKGNYDEAKRLENLAKANGAYKDYAKLEKIGQEIQQAYKDKDQTKVDKLQKDYQQEIAFQGLGTVGGTSPLEIGGRQPESFGTKFGFSAQQGSNYDPATGLETNTKPTEASERIKTALQAAEFVSGTQPLKDANNLISEGLGDILDTDTNVTFDETGQARTIKREKNNSILNPIAGLMKIAMGLSAATPSGFATFEGFSAVNSTEGGRKVLEHTLMLASTLAKPYLRNMGYDEKDVNDAGLAIDILAAIVVHGGVSMISGKVKLNKAYNKISEMIKNGEKIDEKAFKDIWDSVDEKTRSKIIRRVVKEYKENPVETQQKIYENYKKGMEVMTSHIPKRKTAYVAAEHPTTVGELANGDKVELTDGTTATIEVSDSGVKSVVDAEGNKTILKGDNETALKEAGVQQVKSVVDDDLRAKAYVNRPNVGTMIINGKKYLISLEEGAKDGVGDLVFEVDDKGNMYNTFDVHPDMEFSQKRKLDIVNEFRKEKGLNEVTELREALPADVEPVSSAEAVAQKIGELRERGDKESKKQMGELLSKTPRLKFVYDNMKEILTQLNEGDKFKLKGDCL